MTRVRQLQERLTMTIAKIAAADWPESMLMTTDELAAVLGLSRHQLEEWRRRGYGPPFIRLTRKSIRYRRADVEAWLTERAVTPKPSPSDSKQR